MAPRPSQNVLYEAANGTNIAMTGMDTNVSSSVALTCRMRNTSASSEMLRCSPAVRNRGHRSPLSRPAVITPSSTLAVSSSSVTSPAARVVYHRPGPCRLMAIGAVARGCFRGPACDGHRLAAMAHQPGREAEPGQPDGGVLAAQDRRRTGRVGIYTCRRGHAHRAPARLRGQPGGRDDDVVQP